MQSLGGTAMRLDASSRFLPFLPSDNASLSDPAAEELFGMTASELGDLLRLPAGGFWATVQADPSLGAYLDSYLRFKRCATRSSHQSTGGGGREGKGAVLQLHASMWPCMALTPSPPLQAPP
jgi:hypothetical protein